MTTHQRHPLVQMVARWLSTIAPYRTVLTLLVLLLVIGGITQPLFISFRNIQNILASQSVVWVIAIPMTFVLVSAGLDLSVGAIATISGVFLAKCLSAGIPPWLTLILTIAVGGVIGVLVNGLLIAKLRLSVFVVTLASMTAITGIIQLWTGSTSAVVNNTFFQFLGSGTLLGLSVPVWIMLLVLIAGYYIQRFTYLGRDIFAVGGNIRAAELSAIRVDRTLLVIYGLAGLGAALGGAIAVGRIGAATAQVDLGLPLSAIAAVLLGGTLLTGGAGSVFGTALGVLFIGGLNNYLSISGVSQAWQQVMIGVVLVLAVSNGLFRRRKTRRSGASRERGSHPADGLPRDGEPGGDQLLGSTEITALGSADDIANVQLEER